MSWVCRELQRFPKHGRDLVNMRCKIWKIDLEEWMGLSSLGIRKGWRWGGR